MLMGSGDTGVSFPKPCLRLLAGFPICPGICSLGSCGVPAAGIVRCLLPPREQLGRGVGAFPGDVGVLGSSRGSVGDSELFPPQKALGDPSRAGRWRLGSPGDSKGRPSPSVAWAEAIARLGRAPRLVLWGYL